MTNDELIDELESKVKALVDKINGMTPQERAENADQIIAFRRLLAASIAKLLPNGEKSQ